MSGPKISLEHWRALVAVVEAEGYAQAATLIHKSQSTVSYAIRKIEDQLGVPIFSMEGRRAVLTPAGRVLYRRGRALLHEAQRVEQTASGLAAGWEPQLSLAVEILFPSWLLLRCLETFALEHPETRIELYESVLGGTEELLQERRVDLAVCSGVPSGFVGDLLMHVRFVAVAAPSHPLHRVGRNLTLDDLREHRHLIVRDSGSRRTQSAAWDVAEQRWTVSNKATSIRAACMGLGFAWFAEQNIREELESGELKPLPLVQGAERWGTLYLVHADPDAAGPGIRKLAGIIGNAAGKCTPAPGATKTQGLVP
ncbi:MAG: LysR family transcriptional regulator [Aquisalimonadaceae bacterium]